MSELIAQEYIYDLAVSPDGRTRFSAQASGLYRFDGRRWQFALTGLDAERFAVTAVSLSPDQAAIFAGATGVVLRSTDGGQSWEAAALAAPPPVVVAITPAPDYALSGTVYAATLEDGVFVSQDHGRRWESWNFGLIGFGVHALLPQANRTLYAGTNLGVFVSENAGRSWRDVAVFDVPVTALAQTADGLLAGTEGVGLWLLRGGTREPIAAEMITGAVDRIVADGANLLVLCDNELLLSRDRGATWRHVDGGQAVTAVAAPGELAPGAVVLAGIENGTIQTVQLS